MMCNKDCGWKSLPVYLRRSHSRTAMCFILYIN
jgi:hypothetical protein